MTPNQSKTSCDQELLSELIDSLIDQQTCYDRELLSKLIVTPIDKHWISDWPTNFLQSRALTRAHSVPERTTTSFSDRKLLSELIVPRSTNKHVMIGSSYQSSLSPRSTRWSELIDSPDQPKKIVLIGSSYQSSLSPRSTNPLNLWLTD